ncbi:sigma-54-dependent Fis family transcriptional regulator [Brevibacillus fluminis]|uniref:Sigma-54-dependent Fis family transcriptional regulator n=1 Tax=Brevibacillus fluminis TaxID=511487 RepID=A0A3M8DGK5_9BACL|nr:sigma-54-dependent Fis family transcriptional regulator [Brevibacillus fluminis]RNB87126.1 sigma-54-dependent Fis family transcriptional regulator [Brevibacillus fluminis]
MFEDLVSMRMWKRFVHEGVIDSARINKRITESWYRCRHGRVDPYQGTGRVVLQADALEQQRMKHRRLLDLAMPQLNRLSPFIHDAGMISLLIDPEGYVLNMQGEKQALQDANAINFVEGVRWTEDEVGTNAIGTALLASEPIMINGSEHYSVASHRWSCSASPIRDENGTLLGVIDVSSPLERSHPQTMATVSSLAFLIEQEWAKARQQDELELMQLALMIPEEEDRLLVVCNSYGQVVFACKRIRWIVPHWAGMQRAELVNHGFAEVREKPFASMRHGGLIGWKVELMQRFNEAFSVSFATSASSVRNFRFEGEAGVSPSFQTTLRDVERVAPTDVNVVIYGESGTGKELIAQAIHMNSSRRNGPFVAVNCGAVPRELMESELFGYAEGAFTGARKRGYEGKLIQANGGTLFLDEIGEIPHAMQVALLRVLQERKVTPIGSREEMPLQIRVIAATHRNLRQQVQEGTFREDLYYRLHVMPVSVPPLRERKEDIVSLIKHYAARNGFSLHITDDVKQLLIAHDWPGNIRELFNVVERLRITPEQEWKRFLTELTDPRADMGQPEQELNYREQVEKQSIAEALAKSHGSAAVAAELLGIPRSTFYRKLKKYQL